MGGEFEIGDLATNPGDGGGQVAESIAERLRRPNYVQAWARCV